MADHIDIYPGNGALFIFSQAVPENVIFTVVPSDVSYRRSLEFKGWIHIPVAL